MGNFKRLGVPSEPMDGRARLALEKELSRKERQLTENEAFLQSRIDEQEKKLVEIAGMTVDQAKEALFADIEAKTQHEAARMARQIESDARDQANRKAKEIICNAIQRYAGDYVGEQTVTAVSLPSEDMKVKKGASIKTLNLEDELWTEGRPICH